jgi:hypothetical protein
MSVAVAADILYTFPGPGDGTHDLLNGFAFIFQFYLAWGGINIGILWLLILVCADNDLQSIWYQWAPGHFYSELFCFSILALLLGFSVGWDVEQYFQGPFTLNLT